MLLQAVVLHPNGVVVTTAVLAGVGALMTVEEVEGGTTTVVDTGPDAVVTLVGVDDAGTETFVVLDGVDTTALPAWGAGTAL